MGSADIAWPIPLFRMKPWFSGQFGVPGTDSERGLRSDCHGVVFYVDPNATGVSDNRDGTDPEAPLNTVAKALTLCQAYRGDVIAVMANGAWQYADGLNRTIAVREEVDIDVAGVKIVGVFPSSAIGVPWESQTLATPCITVSAIDVTIEGFAFVGGVPGGTAIYCEWDGATVFGENLTVRNCMFDDAIDTAIQLEYSWFCDIHHNLFQECAAYGIMADVGGSGTAYTQIHDNLFLNCVTGAISFLGGCDKNFIYHNTIYNANAQAAGVATNEGINTTGGDYNSVYDNTFSCVLPVPANGDWDDLNTAAATDSWNNNHLMNGDSVTNPT